MLAIGYALVRTISVTPGTKYSALAPPVGGWLTWALIAALAVAAGVATCLALRHWSRTPARRLAQVRERSSPQVPPARYCHECGTRMRKDDTFCRRCGVRRRGV